MTDTVQPDAADDAPVDEQPEAENVDTFPREYVEKLRKESAGYREKVRDAEEHSDALARKLHAELVRQTGRLQDPSDVPFAAEHLDDPEALTATIDALLTDKPHLRARKVAGDVGQGKRTTAETVDLAALLRART